MGTTAGAIRSGRPGQTFRKIERQPVGGPLFDARSPTELPRRPLGARDPAEDSGAPVSACVDLTLLNVLQTDNVRVFMIKLLVIAGG